MWRPRFVAVAVGLIAAGASVTAVMTQRGRDEGARCGPGFVPQALRCRVPETKGERCPAPLEPSARGCDAPDQRVLVAAAAIAIGPSDWEAEGRVTARTIRTQAFRIDAFEATRGRYARSSDGDAARAASGMTRADAARFCASQGGRLPSEDEWIVAAASGENPPRRYPWGDTGAVCRRAAWGLVSGPCAVSAAPSRSDFARTLRRDEGGPDTVGAHPDGDSPLGLHDMAGNVAEWVAPEGDRGGTDGAAIAKGGSWQSALASDLRIWARLEIDPGGADSRVGVRCVYPP